MKIPEGKFGSIGSSFDLIFLLCQPTSLAVRFQAFSEFGRSNGKAVGSNSFRTQMYVCVSSTLLSSFVLLEAVFMRFLFSVVFPYVTRGCMYAFPLLCSLVLIEAVCTRLLYSVVFPCATRGCMYAFPFLCCVPLCY